MKKLAPFGKSLNQLLLKGRVPTNDVYCFCGINAWKKASYFSKHRFCLCLPPYEAPSIYQWPVMNCEVIIFETGTLRIVDIEELAYCLLQSGASIVRAVNYSNQIAVFKRKEAA